MSAGDGLIRSTTRPLAVKMLVGRTDLAAAIGASTRTAGTGRLMVVLSRPVAEANDIGRDEVGEVRERRRLLLEQADGAFDRLDAGVASTARVNDHQEVR